MKTRSAASPAISFATSLWFGRVADEQPVVAENPQIARDRDRRLRKFRNRVFVGQPLRRILRGEQPRQLFVLEADESEIEVLVLQRRKFSAKQLVVPAGVQRELIVRDDVRALLRLGQVIQNDHRHFFELQLARGKKPPVPGDDAGLGVHQDRIVEAELRDARGDLRDLRVGVRSRISRVGNQLFERPMLDLLRLRDIDES